MILANFLLEDDSDEEVFTSTVSSMQCVDREDCKKLGIIDDTSCEFTPWAKDRCPVTCGTCTTKEEPVSGQGCVDNDDCQELGIIDADACEFAPWASDRCPVTCGKCKKEEISGNDKASRDNNTESKAILLRQDQGSESSGCEDQPDCEELGIIDETSCEFTHWALERCPRTCNQCSIR